MDSIHLASIPFGSFPLVSIQLASISLGSIQFGSIPLVPIPLVWIPLVSIPVGSDSSWVRFLLGSSPLGSDSIGPGSFSKRSGAPGDHFPVRGKYALFRPATRHIFSFFPGSTGIVD